LRTPATAAASSGVAVAIVSAAVTAIPLTLASR
jgi:hypothetical protein